MWEDEYPSSRINAGFVSAADDPAAGQHIPMREVPLRNQPSQLGQQPGPHGGERIVGDRNGLVAEGGRGRGGLSAAADFAARRRKPLVGSCIGLMGLSVAVLLLNAFRTEYDARVTEFLNGTNSSDFSFTMPDQNITMEIETNGTTIYVTTWSEPSSTNNGVDLQVTTTNIAVTASIEMENGTIPNVTIRSEPSSTNNGVDLQVTTTNFEATASIEMENGTISNEIVNFDTTIADSSTFSTSSITNTTDDTNIATTISNTTAAEPTLIATMIDLLTTSIANSLVETTAVSSTTTDSKTQSSKHQKPTIPWVWVDSSRKKIDAAIKDFFERLRFMGAGKGGPMNIAMPWLHDN